MSLVLDPRRIRRGKAIKVALCAVLLLAVIVQLWSLVDPDHSIKRFKSFDTSEEFVLDPLIVSGSLVVDKLLVEVQNRKMARRLYAIIFLGRGRFRKSIPVLQRIATDDTENQVYRIAALSSLFGIDEKEAKKVGLNLGDELSASAENWYLEHRKVSRSYHEAVYSVLENEYDHWFQKD